MNLSKAEQAELEKLAEKHPVIRKLQEEVKSFYEDPSKMFYSELQKTIVHISKEMEKFRKGEDMEGLSILDKTAFDVYNKILTNSEDWFKGLSKGKELISPDEVDELKEKRMNKSKGLAF